MGNFITSKELPEYSYCVLEQKSGGYLFCEKYVYDVNDFMSGQAHHKGGLRCISNASQKKESISQHISYHRDRGKQEIKNRIIGKIIKCDNLGCHICKKY